jgi:hypothetical protein
MLLQKKVSFLLFLGIKSYMADVLLDKRCFLVEGNFKEFTTWKRDYAPTFRDVHPMMLRWLSMAQKVSQMHDVFSADPPYQIHGSDSSQTRSSKLANEEHSELDKMVGAIANERSRANLKRKRES